MAAKQQPTAYTPDAIIAELRDDLTPWAKEKKGTVSVATDPYNFLELLAQSPVGFQVVLHWDGEALSGDEPQSASIAVQKISAGVTFNTGLTVNPSEALVKASPIRPALLKLLTQVRDRIRSYNFPADTTGQYLLYKGADPVVLPEGLPLAGFRLNFELTIGLPEIDYRNQV
jgi:hypothetical protein